MDKTWASKCPSHVAQIQMHGGNETVEHCMTMTKSSVWGFCHGLSRLD